jgi:NADPH:quinone reductase-like Zn-dependent oxidoreductase
MSAIHTQAIIPTPAKLSASSLSVLSPDAANLTASLNDTEKMGGGGCLLIPGCGGAVGNSADMMSSIIIAGLAGSMIWGGI